MKTTRGLSVAAASLILGIAAAAHAEMILFSCSNPPAAYYGLYSMKDDGTAITPVITNRPVWAPGVAENGFDVAFVDPDQLASNIYLTTVYGASPVAVNNTNKAFAARCYSSNEVLFLARRSDSTYQVWRIKRNGTGERPVLTTTFNVFPVGIEAFDVDSAAEQAYVSGAGPSGMTLWRINVTNGVAVNMAITTNSYGDHYNPALSPDKTRLAYSADFGEGSHRAVVSPAQIAATAFVDVTTNFCGNPAWSRGGGTIAYTKAFFSTFGGRTYTGYISKTATNAIAEVNLTTNTVCGNRCAFPNFYVKPTTWYVSVLGDDNNNGASWATPLKTIQRAVDLAEAGNMVIVSNGVYAEGGALTPDYASSNRVMIAKQITLRSLNGPDATVIIGQGPMGSNAVRCVYVTSNAVVEGFCLSNGFTFSAGNDAYERSGGGALVSAAGTLTNCLLTMSSAGYNGGGAHLQGGGLLVNCRVTRNNATSNRGGGVSLANGAIVRRSFIALNTGFNGGAVYNTGNGTLDACVLSNNTAIANYGAVYSSGAALYRNCLIVGNSAATYGGLALLSGGVAVNCTIVSNTSSSGGAGVHLDNGGALTNCIVYLNNGPNWSTNGVIPGGNVAHTCTTPSLFEGNGNITNNPAFAAVLGNDFTLQGGSPCQNAGATQSWMVGATDLAGNPRIIDGLVDMGCYEFVPEPVLPMVLAALGVVVATRRKTAGLLRPRRNVHGEPA